MFDGSSGFENQMHYLDRGETPVFWWKERKRGCAPTKRIEQGFGHNREVEAQAKMLGMKNGQSRPASRYILVLPLGQTASELLSRQSLARWRTESCPGASGWRSEEKDGEQA